MFNSRFCVLVVLSCVFTSTAFASSLFHFLNCAPAATITSTHTSTQDTGDCSLTLSSTSWMEAQSASTLSTYGGLHAVATADLSYLSSVVGSGNSIAGNARAGMSDGFHIVSGPTSGYLAFQFSIDGSLSGTVITSGSAIITPSTSAFLTTNDTYGKGTLFFSDQKQLFNGLTLFTEYVPYSFSAATVQFELEAAASCAISNAAKNASCDDKADFSNTAQITHVDVLDQNQNLVQGASITTDSGTDYNAVPEPGSMILFGTGLLTIASRLRRRS